MGNLLIGLPLGRVRPYATVGAGLMRSNLDWSTCSITSIAAISGSTLAAGVMAFLTDNFGIRGDTRQFRSLQNDDPDDDSPEPGDFDLGDFKFWRATAGSPSSSDPRTRLASSVEPRVSAPLVMKSARAPAAPHHRHPAPGHPDPRRVDPRHPGTISLGQGIVSYGPPPEVLQAVQAFGERLADHRYGPVEGQPDLLAILREKLTARERHLARRPHASSSRRAATWRS